MSVTAALRRYRVELLWVAFAAANYAAMIAWPSWETIPFHFVWISLTLLYGFRVWPMQATLIVLAVRDGATGASIGLDAFRGIQLWGELFEVPLMAAMFLAMVWHARRRVDALQIAEQRSEQRRSLLERQERFIHDASHELRTPVTIARGHLELQRGEHRARGARRRARRAASGSTGSSSACWCSRPPTSRISCAAKRSISSRCSRTCSCAGRRSRRAPGSSGRWFAARLLVDADRLRAALDALLENAVKYTEAYAAIELRAGSRRSRGVLIEVEDEGGGVPPQALERIFDRFARADPARTRSAGGSVWGSRSSTRSPRATAAAAP